MGGIYTVIRSKAYISTEEMGDQYCLIGPYKEHCARTEVEEGPLGSESLNRAVDALRNRGFKVHTGRWLVDGNPQIILMDIGSASWKLDEFKDNLWSTTNIGVPHLDIESNDAIILGYMVADFIQEVHTHTHTQRTKVINFLMIQFLFSLRIVPKPTQTERQKLWPTSTNGRRALA